MLSSIRFGHSLSYRVSEEFSVGGSIYVDYATWETKVAFDTPGTSDGYLSVEDEDPAVGAMASFMYTPGDTTRIGVTYRSKVVHNFKDKPDTRFSGVSDVIGDIEAEFELPQMVLVGVRQELTPKLAILMSGSWEEWSKFGELQVKTRAGEDDIDRNYDDTYSVGIGLEYQLTDEWLLMCGYKYDSSVQTRSTRTADLPHSSQRRYAVGAEYKYSKKMTIGVAYEYADLGTPKLDQTGNLSGTISGEYAQYIQFFTLSCTYNF